MKRCQYPKSQNVQKYSNNVIVTAVPIIPRCQDSATFFQANEPEVPLFNT